LPEGSYHLGTPFLVECKNWETPVPSREIVNFSHLLEMRACRDGILVAASGITGTPGTLTESYFEVAVALAKGRRILVINRVELESFFHTDHIVELLKIKMLELAMLSTLQQSTVAHIDYLVMVLRRQAGMPAPPSPRHQAAPTRCWWHGDSGETPLAQIPAPQPALVSHLGPHDRRLAGLDVPQRPRPAPGRGRNRESRRLGRVQLAVEGW
jgi:hypothetical protein